VQKFLCRIVLMLGNVVIGMTILGPAGMLAEMATGLGVGIHDTGLLVTYGAIVVCVGSPVTAWLTTRIDRRRLLVETLAILALGQAASALITNYDVILALRLLMLAIGAVYTPQAAATVALIVEEHERASALPSFFSDGPWQSRAACH
jgi:predicted MFS family arabinose efflux permease